MDEQTPPGTTPPPPQTPAAPPAAAAAPEMEQIDIDHFFKVKLRVARIEAAEAVPKSKKLLRLQIDLGPLGKRQILSGIALHYQPEQLVGRKIIVVANLKPAMLMGQESQGMLLAGSTPGDAVLSLLTPDKDLPEGSEIR